MKIVLAAIVTLASIVVLADIPRPHSGPRVEPGPLQEVEAESLNVLVYGAPSAKLAELKAGSNTMLVQVQRIARGISRFVYTSRNCSYGIAGNMCVENKQLSITKTETVIPDHKSVTYRVSDVVRLR